MIFRSSLLRHYEVEADPPPTYFSRNKQTFKSEILTLFQVSGNSERDLDSSVVKLSGVAELYYCLSRALKS